MKVTRKDLVKLANIILDIERIYREENYWTEKYSNHPLKELEVEIFREWDGPVYITVNQYLRKIQEVASLLYSEAQVM
jgi:hypothetical protein